MSQIIHLEFTRIHSDADADALGDIAGATSRRAYTKPLFQRAVKELEKMVAEQRASIRLVVEETSDVSLTMQFIFTSSPLLYNHLLETLPPGAMQDSLVKEHHHEDEDAPLRLRVIRYLRANPLKGFVFIVLLGAAGLAVYPDFSKTMLRKLYNTREKIYSRASLPFESGWVLLGQFSENRQQYADGPYAMIIKSDHNDKGTIIRPGDVIVITRELDVIIADYMTGGVGNVNVQPWQSRVINSNDYTGVKIRAGQKVRVLDVGYGISDTYLREVWARIGNLKH